MRYGRILVVKDKGIADLDVTTLLSDLGYEVVGLALTGEDAIQRANVTRPDLVLMGIQLSGDIDGIKAARHIWNCLDIPVVFLTADADTETLDRAKGTHPYGYLVEPVNQAVLRSTIEIAIHKHRAEKWERQHTQELQREITYRKLIENELRTMQQAIASSINAIVLTDLEGHMTYVNPAFLRLWRCDHQREVHGNHITHIWENSTAITPMLSTLQNGGSWAGHLTARRGDGSTFNARISSSMIKNDDNAPIGMMFSIIDITAQIETEAALWRYAEELAARNEELDAYGHTIAHELKNPLSVIKGFAEMLSTDNASLTTSELRLAFDNIEQSSNKMLRIIDALLLLGRVRETDLQAEPLDMEGIVIEALKRVFAMQMDRNATVNLPSDWPTALGYASWVEDVWVNLLSNAIKYGGDPPIVELGSAREADGTIQFWVRDNGPGLTVEEQASLFTPYERLGRTGVGGCGLGLSIVRRIVDKLGGDVGVESEVNQGSCFYFSLPAAPQERVDAG